MLGLAARIHEMVMITPGMMMRPKVTRPTSFAHGVFVRSTTQARKVPAKNAQNVESPAK
jgi:hypothetical protein